MYAIKDEASGRIVWEGNSKEGAKAVLRTFNKQHIKKNERDPRVLIYEYENRTREIPSKRLKKLAIKAYDNNLEVIEKLEKWGVL